MDDKLLYLLIFIIFTGIVANWKGNSKAYYLDKGKKIGFTLNAIIFIICLGIALIILINNK